MFQFENIEKIVLFDGISLSCCLCCLNCLLLSCCLGPQFSSIHPVAGLPGGEETNQADPAGRQGHHIHSRSSMTECCWLMAVDDDIEYHYIILYKCHQFYFFYVSTATVHIFLSWRLSRTFFLMEYPGSLGPQFHPCIRGGLIGWDSRREKKAPSGHHRKRRTSRTR